jgi:hypothetical protein
MWLIRGAFLWTIWNERNHLIFQDGNCKILRSLGESIIALLKYWCLIKGSSYLDSLHHILPANVNSLPVQLIRDILKIKL